LLVGLALAFGVGRAPGSSGQVIFRDNFSNPRSGWWVGQDKVSAASYNHGQYWVRIKTPNNDLVVGNDLHKIVATADMQIDVIDHTPHDKSLVSLVCYTNAGRDIGYYFAISPAARSYAIVRQGAGENVLVTGFNRRAIRGIGKTNHLSARCVGARKGPATLTFFVNGRFVATAHDRVGFRRFAAIGLDLNSKRGGSVASFDNALARER